MKKIIKLLFVFMLFYAFEVKADYNAFLVDSEYTTVVSGDEFKLKAGFDTVWDESVVKDDNQNNELHDFYIAFDSRAFDVNLDNIKYENSNYETSEHTYYTEEQKGYMTVYTFYNIFAKELLDSEDNMYDGKIDNLVLSNILVKVKDDVTGVYNIETGHSETYDKNEEPEVLPITIISKESSNKVDNITLKCNSLGLANSKTYDIKVEDNKKTYEIGYYHENFKSGTSLCDYINVSCSSKCKVDNIGSEFYQDNSADVIKEYNINVKYLDNKKDNYVVKNEFYNASIDFGWAYNGANYILIITSSNNEQISYKELIKDNKDFYTELIYNYDKLNDIDKKILKDVLDQDIDKYSFEDAHIYIINDGKILYNSNTKLSEEELLNILNNKQPNPPIDTKTDSVESNINIYYILIGVLSLVIVVCVIILIVRKNKKNEK